MRVEAEYTLPSDARSDPHVFTNYGYHALFDSTSVVIGLL